MTWPPGVCASCSPFTTGHKRRHHTATVKLSFRFPAGFEEESAHSPAPADTRPSAAQPPALAALPPPAAASPPAPSQVATPTPRRAAPTPPSPHAQSQRTGAAGCEEESPPMAGKKLRWWDGRCSKLRFKSPSSNKHHGEKPGCGWTKPESPPALPARCPGTRVSQKSLCHHLEARRVLSIYYNFSRLFLYRALFTYTNTVILYTVFNQVIKVTFFQKVQSYECFDM